ncbi:MAG TPA: protein kinase, partial [Polyangiaceae bacterium]|nr:protein kinase [Polyangiaceae bacterium]
MGSVWLAEHLSLHSPIAIKLISKEFAQNEEGLQRFLREARLAASLRSPHVVQIFDYGVEQGAPYIAMELLEGESLAQRLTRVRRLSLSQTELVLRHVGRAVARAHDVGVVHRDLKPGNIFIVRNEDEELIKLLDFGVAKHTIDTPSHSVAAQTRTGAFLGTPFYVSPEQARGSKAVDHRTDIWAIGVIAFECLIGRPPFDADTFGDLVHAICSQPIPVPSEHASVPGGFDTWFARACARDRAARFQSVREAIAELRRVLDPGAADIAIGRTRTSLTAPPEAVLEAVRNAAAEVQSRRPRLNTQVARLAGGAMFIALATALWIAWRSGSSRERELDASGESPLPVSPRGAATPTVTAGTSPGASSAPVSVVSPGAPARVATPAADTVHIVPVEAPPQALRDAPAAARTPRSTVKVAGTRGAGGSAASGASRAPR